MKAKIIGLMIGAVICWIAITTLAIMAATPPPPGELGIVAPEGPPTNNVSGYFVVEPEYEWEIVFESSPDLAFTNITRLPVTVQVPFEHDREFVRLKARKVRVR